MHLRRPLRHRHAAVDQAWYAGLGGGGDYDLLVHVKSEAGLPILGDGVMTDFVGRFDMASHMLANSPDWWLTNPDFSYYPGYEETVMGIFNVGTANAGPLFVEYYDGNGTPIGGTGIASLPPKRSVRLHPGVAGYPSGPVGYGWVRILACNTGARLVGWSVRAILDNGVEHYHKAFGESLDGILGAEPGAGFSVVDPDGVARLRKVSPIVRFDPFPPFFYFPGYETFANTDTANVGSYSFLFYNPGGSLCSSPFPFAGLPWAYTSTTLEDPLVFPLAACVGTGSGRVDVQHGPIKGINVIGDPLDELGIEGFAGGSDPGGGEDGRNE